VALFPQAARGYQERATVVVLQPTEEAFWASWPEAEQRVLAELGAAGFDVQIDGASLHEDSREALREAARRHHALGAIRVARDGTGAVIDIWLEKPDPGGLRTIVVADVEQPESASAAGLESAELVHTSWLKIRLPEQPAPASSDIPADRPPAAATDDAAPWRFVSSVGVGFVAPVSDLDPVGAVALCSRLRLFGPLLLEPDLWLTPLAARLESEAGTVELRAGLARLHFVVEPWPEAHVVPSLGVGAGTLVAWSDGQPTAGHAGVADRTAVGLLSVRARLAFALSDRVRLSVVGDAAYGIPDVVVRVDGQQSARLSRPLLDNFVLLDWSWL
jgi:hypothetical protein